MTGLTGLVGSAFAVDMLGKEPRLEIYALVRGSRTASASERGKQAIEGQCAFDGTPELAADCLARTTMIDSKLDPLPDPSSMATYGPFDAFFHCAADVNLGKDPDGKTYATNLNGAKNALALAKALAIPAFHLVSTAYVGGKSEGRIMEDSQPATDFHNAYERSKFEAEKLVRAAGIPFSIYRPSIVVGRLSDGAIRKPLAFYRLLEFMGKLKKRRCAQLGVPASSFIDLPIRLEAAYSDKIYFVPVDYVKSAIARLFRLCPQGAGKTYHITGESPVTLKQIEEALERSLGAKGIVVLDKIVDPNAEERLVSRLIGDLMPYFSSQMTFDDTNVKDALGEDAVAWKLDLDFLIRMARSYFHEKFPDLKG